MRPRTLRSGLITVALLMFAVAAWVYFAPTQVGGSTSYVVTSGTSMEPRFHTGDLALVRPADHYLVGEIVAYHSTALHEVVLHRIVSRDGERYVFKGDHNSFLDPTRPTRADLVGVLWLHVPHAGLVLKWLHSPITAAALIALFASMVLLGAEEKRRRRNRRRSGANARQGTFLMTAGDRGLTHPVNLRAVLGAATAAAAVFFVLGVFALTRSPNRPAAARVPYTQVVKFGYGASAPRGPVYPDGVLHTGDPIFLALVHRVRVQVDYRVETSARHRLAGTEETFLRLSGPSGWSRNLRLSSPRRFKGDHVSTQVTLDVPQLQSLIARVGALTGVSPGAGYTIAVAPQVNVTGTLAGRQVNASFAPQLSFQLGPLQLQSGNASSSSGGSQAGLTPSQSGSVAIPSSASNTVGVAGLTVSVTTLRWLALLGLLLAGASALVLRVWLKIGQPFEETQRIQSKYGHLIVPIVATADALSWAPYEVPDIKALARLAESGDRLILHHRDEEGDTYLVNDESTVYRYRIRDNRVRWNEWSEPRASLGVTAPSVAPTSAAGDHPPAGEPLPHPDRSEQTEPGGEAHGVGDPGQVGTPGV
jgi:signal peptidase I